MKRAYLAALGLITLCACSETTAPPPPPALLATGDWVGDWRLLVDSQTGENDLIRFTTVLTDNNGTLSGTCKFEVIELLPAFLACDRAAGTRSGDHLSANLTLGFDFSGSSGSVIDFTGTLQPGVISGTLHVIYPGYEFRPRSAARNAVVPSDAASVEATPGSPERERLLEALRALSPDGGCTLTCS